MSTQVSPFAALLRRSKFASYDPSISQVYTAFGGDAHRGNFGLKRPLALRRRNPYIAVRSVDSKEQQTEWAQAEDRTRWIRMYDEVGVYPKVDYGGSWSQKLGPLSEVEWKVDSEFGSAKKESGRIGGAKASEDQDETDALTNVSMATPNIHAMTEKEFAAYLQKLRELRPAFRAYLEKATAKDGSEPTSMWQQSIRPARHHKIFLQKKAWKDYNSSPESRVIEQQPHHTGGLTYTRESLLQSYFLTKPQPGRVLSVTTWGNGKEYIASFAGNTASLNKNLREAVDPIDWKTLADVGVRDPQQGATEFRFIEANLNSVPAVVGQRQSLGAVVMSTVVKGASKADMTRPNPHWPGSREYVGHSKAVIKAPAMLNPVKPAKKPAPKEEKPVDSALLLESLAGLIKPNSI